MHLAENPVWKLNTGGVDILSSGSLSMLASIVGKLSVSDDASLLVSVQQIEILNLLIFHQASLLL